MLWLKNKCSKLIIVPLILFLLISFSIPFSNKVFLKFKPYQVKAQSGGTSYYVASNGGNDSNPGTEAQPFLTIQKAADSVNANDTVIVKSGTYNERVDINKSSITFKAQGEVIINGGFDTTADLVKIDGFRVTGANTCGWSRTDYNIYISGSKVEVTNCYIYKGKRGGVKTEVSSNECTIKDNEFYQNGDSGLEIHGTNHRIENNNIYDSRCWCDSNADADGIRYFGSGHVFKGNKIYDITFDSPENKSCRPHIDAFQTWDFEDGIANNMTFDGNWIELTDWQADVEYGKGWEIEGLRDSVIKNNIVKAVCGLAAVSGSNNSNLTIVNNTFIGNLNPPCSVGSNCWPAALELSGVSGCTAKNNIFVDWAYSHAYGSSLGGLDNNLIYWSNGQNPPGSPKANDLWGIDPKFVNPSGNDYHLQSSSPAINAGVTISSVTNDYDGNPRPQRSVYDIGAYEYTGVVQPTVTPQPTNTATPVPTATSTPQLPTPTPFQHCLPFGDIDCNTKINLFDFGYLVKCWGLSSYPAANLDDSGVVGKEDALILLGNYGKSN